MQTTDSLLARITTDSRVLAGKLVVRGLRISVEQLLKELANRTIGLRYLLLDAGLAHTSHPGQFW